MAPLIVLSVAIAGAVFGREAPQGQIAGELGSIYSAQILLFGAEFTECYASTRGSKVEPSKNAVLMPDSSDNRSYTDK